MAGISLITSFADDPAWADVMVLNADRSGTGPRSSFEWWLTAAEEADRMGVDKKEFTGWVSNHYGDDENRFQASVAWDVYKLGESQ